MNASVRALYALSITCAAIVPACAPNSAQQATAVRIGLSRGLSRTATYDSLRSENLVAFNWNYAMYAKTAPNSYSLIEHSDEWPEPGQRMQSGTVGPEKEEPIDPAHPFVKVKFIIGYPSLFCENDIYLKILFDSHDRISSVDQSPVTRDCSPL